MVLTTRHWALERMERMEGEGPWMVTGGNLIHSVESTSNFHQLRLPPGGDKEGGGLSMDFGNPENIVGAVE